MSRFNQPAASNSPSKVANHEGAPAYALSSEMELYTLVCNSLVQPKFYEDDESQLERLKMLVKAADPAYVANLASYARNEMGLRTIPVVLAVLLARYHGGSVARQT